MINIQPANSLAPSPAHETRAQAIRTLVRELAGEVDFSALELVRCVHLAANTYEAAVDERLRETGLSGPRWALLLRLLAEERCAGCPDGLSPTHLSQHQNVSKNTISALLRGLEEQGLIERALDPDDRRGFRIRLTAAGRQLVETTTPGHIAFLERLAAGLSADERSQLIGLLEKLHRSILEQAEGC